MLRKLSLTVWSLLLPGILAILVVSGVWAGVQYVQHRPLVIGDLGTWLFWAGTIAMAIGIFSTMPDIRTRNQVSTDAILAGARAEENARMLDRRFRVSRGVYMAVTTALLWAASFGIYYLFKPVK